MGIQAAPDLFQIVRDVTIYPFLAGGGGGVPTTRVIAGTSPITINGGPSATLAADITVAINVSGGGAAVVGTGRTLQGTAPIRIAGDNAPHDLSANLVFSVVPFSGTVDGIVTHNPSGAQGKFLKDDNTWGTSTSAGVTSITTSLPLVATSPTGDIVMAVNVVNLTNAGVVPAIGVADATKVLTATNPPTWAHIGASGFVTLQAAPGVADAGDAHVSGVMMADSGFHAGSILAPTSTPQIQLIYDAASFVSISNPPPSAMIGVAAYTGDTAQAGTMGIRRSRGSSGAPTATQDWDTLGKFTVSGRGSGGWSSWGSSFDTYADGIPSGTVQKTVSDVVAGGPTGATYVRVAKEGVRVGTVNPSGSGDFAPGQRPLHGLDIRTSLGLGVANITAATYSAGAAPVIFCDTTANNITVTLPSAAAGAMLGRTYFISKVDNSANFVQINNALNNPATGVLFAFRDAVILTNDGSGDTGWQQVFASFEQAFGNETDGIVVANTVAETTTKGLIAGANGQLWTLKASGVFSTTGAPTLRFRVKTPGANLLADSGAVTMPTTITNAKWWIEVENGARSIAGTHPVTQAKLMIAQGTGLGAAINTYQMTNNAAADPSGIGTTLTLQWGTADPANTALLKQYSYVTHKYATV